MRGSIAILRAGMIAVALAASVVGAVADCKLPETTTFLHPSARVSHTGYGWRIHPILMVNRLHTGLDYVGPVGDPVVAAAAGVVRQVGFEGASGNFVVIEHSPSLITRYAHMTSRLAVNIGECVSQGQVIGYLGNTGFSTTPHLHFEVQRDGKPIDPKIVLPGR